MTIPLNELSAIYNQSIAEDCECEDKKKEKKVEMIPQGKTPMGGDGARPGKNRKSYIEPMSIEEVEPVKEGHCDVEGVECSPVEKKKDKKKVKENYSHWRTDLREIVDVADQEEVTKSSPKTDTEAPKQIKEKNVKNKIKINPPQGVTEGFKEIGGVVVEMYEIGEADMTGAPSIKNAKMPKKTDVKYDSHMKVMAPSIKKEGLSVADQMRASNEYFKKRAARSPEEKEAEKKKDAEGRAKNLAMHKKPDPYKARAGESD